MVWGSGPPESGSQPIVVGPGVDPEIWWVVSEDNPFPSSPTVGRGQGLVGGRGLGQAFAQCLFWLHLKQGPGGLGPVRLGRGWRAKRVDVFSWIAAVNKAYLAFLFFSFSFFASSSLSLKTLKAISRSSR